MTANPCGSRVGWSGALALLLAVCAARADSLPSYTGYTRPGAPGDTREGDKIVLVSGDATRRKEAVGGTIYYIVLQRKGDSKTDPWNSGIPDLASRFKRGADAGGTTSSDLDLQAEYLYLFQVINDRGTDLPIQGIAVKLHSDLKKDALSSWGNFHGMGFVLERAAGRPRSGCAPGGSPTRRAWPGSGCGRTTRPSCHRRGTSPTPAGWTPAPAPPPAPARSPRRGSCPTTRGRPSSGRNAA
jgi:hypothetical protein